MYFVAEHCIMYVFGHRLRQFIHKKNGRICSICIQVMHEHKGVQTCRIRRTEYEKETTTAIE